MLEYFERLEGHAEQRDVRYVLTLLLIRRRLRRLDRTTTDTTNQEQAVLFCPRNEKEYRVDVVLPDEQRVRAIQRELASLLFGDQARAATAPTGGADDWGPPESDSTKAAA